MIQPTYRSPGPPALSAARAFVLLAGAQTLLALVLLLAAQPASEAGVLLGLSPFRLALAAAFLALLLVFAGLLAAIGSRPRFERGWTRLSGRLDRPAVWSSLLLAAGLVCLGAAAFLTLLPDLRDSAAAVAARLTPPAVLALGFSAQTVVMLLVLRHGRDLWSLRARGRAFYLTLLFYALLFLAWSWVMRAVLPTESQHIGWNPMGVPLLGIQVLAAWLASVLLIILTTAAAGPGRQVRLPWGRLDLWLSLLIWLAAVIAWQTAPLVPNWFLTEPVHPNFETYPNSDARSYDITAQTALIGEGYTSNNAVYVRRSLLALVIAGLHVLAGQDYERVIFLQILVLALLPVALYWVTRTLHNRYSGLLMAALVVLRETNSIRAAGDITTSNAKLLMADLPATLLVAGFVLVALAWLKNIENNREMALAAGGALGLSMLVRLETAVFIFPLALIAALILWPRRKFGLWLQSGLLAGLGILLVISPWIWRNYSLTGQIFIDNPYYQDSLFIQRFHPSREVNPQDLDAEGLPPEQSEIPLAPSTAPPPGDQPANPTPLPTQTPHPDQTVVAREFIRSNVGRLAGVMLGHTLNSQLQSLLILPSSPRLVESTLGFAAHRSAERWGQDCCTVRSYVRALPFWRQWDGRFPTGALVPLALNLLLIAYGVSTAWKRRAWMGIAPALLALTYILFNGVFRNSGGRYILPVDWITLLYFSIGLAQITQNAFAYLGLKPVPEEYPLRSAANSRSRQPALRSAVLRPARLLTLAFFLIGCIVPLFEFSFNQRYNPAATDAMFAGLLQSDQLSAEARADLNAYLANGGGVVVGRGLYPRYFPPNEGDDVARRSPFAPRPYPRMAFYLVGDTSQAMALRVESKPDRFPNGVDVLAIVCPPRDILALALYSSTGELDRVYLRSPFPSQKTCPLPVEDLGKIP